MDLVIRDAEVVELHWRAPYRADVGIEGGDHHLVLKEGAAAGCLRPVARRGS